jgi:hypothetical protein
MAQATFLKKIFKPTPGILSRVTMQCPEDLARNREYVEPERQLSWPGFCGHQVKSH